MKWGTRITLIAALATACGSQRETTRPPPDPAPGPPDPAALVAQLPTPAGRFAPAHTLAEPGPGNTGAELSDVETCGLCHQDVAAQWETSAHALSSFSNPIYLTAVDMFRTDVGNQASQFCGGCHDVALLVDGAMATDVQPDDVRAHAGIACKTCHGIESVAVDGNGSYTLRQQPIPLPKKDDEASLLEHRRVASRQTLGVALCASCHRSFLGPDTGNPHHLAGQDEVTGWKSSAFTGNGLARIDDPVEKADCIGCHMPKEQATRGDPSADASGTVSSHRFLGGHTWLAAMRKDPDAAARAAAFLQGVASIDVAAARVGTGARALPEEMDPPRPGDLLEVDVVVRNLAVGHRFPAGVRDAQDTWIETTIRDARGIVIARAGADHAEEPDDPGAHILRAMLVDEHGRPVERRETHKFRASIIDHTIAPRDMIATRYRVTLPARTVLPLTFEARLLHRSRSLELQELACQAFAAPLATRFAAGAKAFRGMALDPCKPQPITEMARDRVVLASRTPDERPRWRRLYEHGSALTHTVQEHLDEARLSLEAALAEVERVSAVDKQRAAVIAALALIAARQGRTADALAYLDDAETLAPGHPALAAIRGEALTRVWRWDEAIAPLRAAAGKAPENVGAWVALSIALGSIGRDREALDAAARGLALDPRNGALLRVQALSLEALGAPFEHALDAYDRHRDTDDAPHLRLACAGASADCARERQPVHVHDMRRD
jgi:hypothetical protein